MLSGPIAKVSLRNHSTIQKFELSVLSAVKGNSYTANLLSGNVQWNDTITSLNQAGFPYDQILDYLPPSTAAWTYLAEEWDPTWNLACNYTPETVLHNVTGDGNYNFYAPVDAFPVYRDTYHPSWLNTSEYRMDADFIGWESTTDQDPFRDYLFFILIQSDPRKDNRMYTNNETMQLSISVLHMRDFQALSAADSGESGATSWKPIGPVGNASYSRADCSMTRKAVVANEDAIPWVWTNNTFSIPDAYQQNWAISLEDTNIKNQTVSTPTPQDLLRFYQAYMALVNTETSIPHLQEVSVWLDTVQLSIVFLAIVVILTALTLWLTTRYFWFLRRQDSELQKVYIPDGKIEWMIHAAKTAHSADDNTAEGKKVAEVKTVDLEKGMADKNSTANEPKNRDYFNTATFGYVNTDLEGCNAAPRRPSLARVYAGRHSISGASSFSPKDPVTSSTLQLHLPPPVSEGKENIQVGKTTEYDNEEISSSVDSQTKNELEPAISPAKEPSKT